MILLYHFRRCPWYKVFNHVPFGGNTAVMSEKAKSGTHQAPKKRLGRMPGSPRVPGSGRKIGTPNRIPASAKEIIVSSKWPLKLLLDIAAGRRQRVGTPSEPRFVYPSVEQRMAASRTLLAIPISRRLAPSFPALAATLSRCAICRLRKAQDASHFC